MPWKSIENLHQDHRTNLPSKAQSIFLQAFDTSEPISFSLAAAKSPLIISGPLLEINGINKNNWGIPDSETALIKAGLLGIPLKICSGPAAVFNEHSCDINWNPNDEIGTIISSHEEDGWIHATALVTDPIADSKIQSGTWKRKWSIFAGYQFEDENQMRYGTVPKSITLVKNPAYTNAGFRQVASQSSQNSQSSQTVKENGNMTGENDPKTYTQEEYDTGVKEAVAADHATMTKEQEEAAATKDKEQAAALEAKEEAAATKDKEQAAALEAKDKEIKTLQAAANPDAKAKQEGMVPREEVQTMLAAATESMIPREDVVKMMSAATEKATENTMELLKKQQITAEIAKMQASFDMIKEEEIPTTVEKLMGRSYAALEQDLDMLNKMTTALEKHGSAAVDKFKEANLPTNAKTDHKLSWDANRKEWI